MGASAGVPPSSVLQLHARDFRKAQAIVLGFLGEEDAAEATAETS